MREPEIIVMGKHGCGRCDALRDKLENHFRLPYVFVDSGKDISGFDWRNTLAVDALADAVINDVDMSHPPIAFISGKAFAYVDALKRLKQITAGMAVEKKTLVAIPEPETVACAC